MPFYLLISSNLLTKCIAISSHFSQKLWPTPAQLMYIKLGPASQYFSTSFSALPNLNFLEQSLETSALFSTIITIVNFLPLLDSKCFSSQVSLISQRGSVFNCIPIDNSISRQNSSIFISPKYCVKDVPCTLSLCQCSKASIPIIFLSIDLTTLISILE